MKWEYIILAVSIVLISILGWIYFIYPTATVEISPAVQTVQKEIEIQSSLNESKINWEKELIPLNRFEVSLTDSYSVKTSGEKQTGVEKARGEVKFINEAKKSIKIISLLISS